MRKTVTWLAALVFVLCAASAGAQERERMPAPSPDMMYAQEPRGPMPPGRGPDLGKWWKDSEIANALGLSAQQVSQIEEKFLNHRLQLIDLKAEVERQEARLQPLIEADQPDEAKVGAQLDAMLAARMKLEKANIMMMVSIRRVLTVEQWKRLESIKQERERAWGPHPPGPHGPEGPGYAPAQPRTPRPPRPPDEPFF